MAKLYPGMAFTNIKHNWPTYLPYMLSCSLTSRHICSHLGICLHT